MNPAGISTRAGAKKARQEYINNLRLEEGNIQKTQNALDTLETTGQTPMRPLDNRTQTETYADIEKIKVNATQTLTELGRNLPELYFVANRMESLLPEFSSKYQLGTPYLVFLSTIRRMMKEESKKEQEDLGFEYTAKADEERGNPRRTTQDATTQVKPRQKKTKTQSAGAQVTDDEDTDTENETEDTQSKRKEERRKIIEKKKRDREAKEKEIKREEKTKTTAEKARGKRQETIDAKRKEAERKEIKEEKRKEKQTERQKEAKEGKTEQKTKKTEEKAKEKRQETIDAKRNEGKNKRKRNENVIQDAPPLKKRNVKEDGEKLSAEDLQDIKDDEPKEKFINLTTEQMREALLNYMNEKNIIKLEDPVSATGFRYKSQIRKLNSI